MSTYYALTISAQGTTSPAYFSVTPTSNLQISQGGVTLVPSSPSAETTMVNIYPETLQISAPAGLVSGGVTIITGESRVAGSVVVSPAVSVATVITLYGNGGAQLGQSIIDPGQGGGAFDFPVDAAEGISNADEARTIIDRELKKG